MKKRLLVLAVKFVSFFLGIESYNYSLQELFISLEPHGNSEVFNSHEHGGQTETRARVCTPRVGTFACTCTPVKHGPGKTKNGKREAVFLGPASCP